MKAFIIIIIMKKYMVVLSYFDKNNWLKSAGGVALHFMFSNVKGCIKLISAAWRAWRFITP